MVERIRLINRKYFVRNVLEITTSVYSIRVPSSTVNSQDSL